MDKRSINRLVKRYQAGERDPELIRLLNEAAWEGFHDPWERTEAPGKEVLVQDPPSLPATEAFDPEAVLPFTLDTIKRLLQERGQTWWESDWKSLQVSYRYDRDSDRILRIFYGVEGKLDHIFTLRWNGDRRVDAERLAQALRFCNTWNEDFRWPRAFVELAPLSDQEKEEGKEPLSGRLVLDYQLLLLKGIHQSLFDSLVGDVLAGGWDFWERAAKAGL